MGNGGGLGISFSFKALANISLFFWVSSMKVCIISLAASGSSIEKAVSDVKSKGAVCGQAVAITSKSSFCVKGLDTVSKSVSRLSSKKGHGSVSASRCRCNRWWLSEGWSGVDSQERF